jgi:CRP-like cAMP-binding protein
VTRTSCERSPLVQVTVAIPELQRVLGPAAPHPGKTNERADTRRPSRTTLVPSGQILFSEGEHQTAAVELIEGVVRAVHLLENGNRQILGFLWPGAVMRPSHTALHYYTAETVTACRLGHPNLASTRSESLDVCGAEQILQELLPLLFAIGKKNTLARLAWFLLRIRHHLPYDRGRTAHWLILPRTDVADYLGMSTETVSRTMAEFSQRALIELPTRKTIRFLDILSLSRIAKG